MVAAKAKARIKGKEKENRIAKDPKEKARTTKEKEKARIKATARATTKAKEKARQKTTRNRQHLGESRIKAGKEEAKAGGDPERQEAESGKNFQRKALAEHLLEHDRWHEYR